MRVRKNARSSFIFGVAAFIAAAAGPACSESSFQPITYGAKPWSPPPTWDEPPCTVGYYVAIVGETCDGCTGTSYALCTGISFTQCVCGGPFWPGATCPANAACADNDFPPFGWQQSPD